MHPEASRSKTNSRSMDLSMDIVKRASTAAKSGDVCALSAMTDDELMRVNTPEALCVVAAQHGHLNVIMFLRTKLMNAPRDTSTAASGARTPIWDVMMCHAAAEGGHLHLVQWLLMYVTIPETEYPSLCDAALEGEHFDTLKWLRSVGMDVTPPDVPRRHNIPLAHMPTP